MTKSVLCIGATLIDELYFCDQAIVPSSSNPAHKSTSIGGVVSNIMQHLALLDVNVNCITALGKDNDSAFIQQEYKKMGIGLNDSIFVEEATGKYVSILHPDGNLFVAVCQDMSYKYITKTFLETKSETIKTAEWIIIDTNLNEEVIQWVIDFAREHHKKLIIEPVSVPKAAKLADLNLNGVYMITPNEEELRALSNQVLGNETVHLQKLFERGVSKIWISKGNQGSVMHSNDKPLLVSVPRLSITDSSGAGDAAVAGWIFGTLHEQSEVSSMQYGHALALQILQIKGTVDYSITSEKLTILKEKIYHE
jgi:pseudouridine kinase